jgi:oligogalacturonide transport system substrate-binding protein
MALTMIFAVSACGTGVGGAAPAQVTAETPTSAPATQEPTVEPTQEPTEPPVEEPAVEQATIKVSWWGADARHNATQEAINKFMELNSDVKVDVQFAAWDGWEEAMSTQFFAGTAPDMNQINWNWITSFSSDGSKFVDLNKYSNIIDLTQFNQNSLDQCVLAGELQAIPVSMTGRIFYWNETTFEKAGVSTPKTLEELYAAADAFHSVLGDDYYPLSLGEYDRAILLVYYLESIYGKAWVVDDQLNYTKEEIEVGLQFFNELEEKGVIPSIETIAGDGAASLDKNPKWIEGKYAGIFEWDSSAPKFRDALAEGQNLVVGDYFTDIGDFKGGFSKVSLAFAISETSKYPEQCARLIEFLLNDDQGTAIMASQRGIPLSKKALDNCIENDLLDSLTAEANVKVLDWVSYPLDPKFEDAKLKGTPDGTYIDVFSGLSYGDYDVPEAADVLISGINAVLGS